MSIAAKSVGDPIIWSGPSSTGSNILRLFSFSLCFKCLRRAYSSAVRASPSNNEAKLPLEPAESPIGSNEVCWSYGSLLIRSSSISSSSSSWCWFYLLPENLLLSFSLLEGGTDEDSFAEEAAASIASCHFDSNSSLRRRSISPLSNSMSCSRSLLS